MTVDILSHPAAFYKENSLTFLRQDHIIHFRRYRGVAQMVACLVRDQEAAGSSPATPTKNRQLPFGSCLFFISGANPRPLGWHPSPVAPKGRGDGAIRRGRPSQRSRRSRSGVQVPPLRQKKPTAFRFRVLQQKRENSISVGSFFLPKSKPHRLSMPRRQLRHFVVQVLILRGGAYSEAFRWRPDQ